MPAYGKLQIVSDNISTYLTPTLSSMQTESVRRKFFDNSKLLTIVLYESWVSFYRNGSAWFIISQSAFKSRFEDFNLDAVLKFNAAVYGFHLKRRIMGI